MSKSRRILCGVPKEECSGGLLMTDQKFTTNKAHSSHEDAFRCMVRHLLRQGYIQRGSHEFQKDENSPVTVLGRKSKYGGLLVSGKGGDAGKRYMPEKRRNGNRGVIIG